MATSKSQEATATPGLTTTRTQTTGSLTIKSPTPIPGDNISWDEVTNILVGPTEQEFLVHTEVLRKVEFFRACLDADMKETRENLIRMPEDPPDAFSELVQWVYTNKFSPRLLASVAKIETQLSRWADNQDCRWINDFFTTMIRLYILAKKLCSEKLQNDSLDIILAALHWRSPQSHGLKIVHQQCDPEDKLHMLISQDMAFLIHSYGWTAFRETERFMNFASESVEAMDFLMDASFQYTTGVSVESETNVCKWHTHIDTPKCAKRQEQWNLELAEGSPV